MRKTGMVNINIDPSQIYYPDHISWVLDEGSYRSSCQEVYCKKGVLRNFAKFTGKRLCQSLFFNKVTGIRPATLLKRDYGTGFFL